MSGGRESSKLCTDQSSSRGSPLESRVRALLETLMDHSDKILRTSEALIETCRRMTRDIWGRLFITSVVTSARWMEAWAELIGEAMWGRRKGCYVTRSLVVTKKPRGQNLSFLTTISPAFEANFPGYRVPLEDLKVWKQR
jgi:hypothetical protein